MKQLPIENFTHSPLDLWSKRWLLLTAGDFAKNEFNAMTIGWGSFGVMWRKPFVQVVVRPTRYTHEFMERFDTFTVCALPEKYRKALTLLGTKSGRDGDKIKEAGLTPVASSIVAAAAFAEADLIVECKKMYWQDLDPAHFLDKTIESNYPKNDYHRIYFGEILGIFE